MNINRNVNKGSLETTYNEVKSSLMRFAFRYLKKPNDVEDVVQEAFVKVIKIKNSSEIKDIKPYLFQTVKNLSFNYLQKSEYKLSDSIGDFEDENVSIDSQTLEEEFESRQRFELFCRAVRVLPIKCQRVYILRKVYGFSQKEIAQHMNISVKTVEAHLTKAIVRCTDFMDEADNADNVSTIVQKQKNG
jgi:RNA polymerase sigma-70 factor (ECF subfamily)